MTAGAKAGGHRQEHKDAASRRAARARKLPNRLAMPRRQMKQRSPEL
jgi:hypothetical protein